jgi:cytochrome P450
MKVAQENTSQAGGDLQLDLFSPEFKRDPFPTFARMRRDAPIYGHKSPNGSTIWYITRYEDVLAILRDDENFCKDPRNTGVPIASGSASRKTTMQRLINENMLFSDPPDHTRLRALVSQAFTPQRIEEQSAFLLQSANSLIDRFQNRQDVDLIEAFALPLPVFVISRLLGIPDDDRDDVALWSQAIISPGSRNLNYSTRKRRVQAFIRYLTQIFAQRTADPQDDLISALVHAEEEGDKLSDFELSSMVALLLVTGHETTVNLIGNGALALIQHPDQPTLLQNNPNLWGSAVEELLRYAGPVETSTSRWACRDIDFNRQLIRRGDLVRVVLSSANRDLAQFEAPDELNIDREDNKHLAFGFGVHYCLGAPLARLEGRIALQTLFERVEGLRLSSSGGELEWRAGVLFRGLESLPVQWGRILNPGPGRP